MAQENHDCVEVTPSQMQTRYQVQTLWTLLNPSGGRIKAVKRKASHRFLDDLCWLCDTKTGGETTTSIAAEDSHGTIRFWVISNKRSVIAVERLKSLLATLHKMDNDDTITTHDVEISILAKTAEDCRQKINNYTRILRLLVREALHQEPKQNWAIDSTNRQDGVELPLESLETFLRGLQLTLTTNTDPLELCIKAYECCYEHSSIIDKKIVLQKELQRIWLLIRHYIGRLASWRKSTIFVVRMWTRAVYLHRPYEIKAVPLPIKPPRPELVQRRDLDRILQSVISKKELQGDIQNLRTTMPNLSRDFCQRMNQTTNKPNVHAEIAMTDHFASYNLQFLNGDRYIGVSKPSCYCCEAFMSNHPLRLQPRLCSNNAYSKWSLPLHKDQQERWLISPASKQAADLMFAKMRQDVQRYIGSGLWKYRRERLFDSLTDLSSSLPTINSLL